MKSEPKIISYDEALNQELPRYYTGDPCKHGHVDERYTSSKNCVVCARASARESMRRKRAAGYRG